MKTWLSPCRSAFGSTNPEANSALHFGGEEQPIGVVVAANGVEERADARAVAGQYDFVRAAIPHADRELPLEVVEELLAMVFPEVRDEFGIGVRAEGVALAFEFAASLGVVEELAVEDGPHALVFVGDGLLPVRESDDRQPAVGDVESGSLEVTVFVRAAVVDGLRHRGHDADGRRPLAAQVEHPRDPAHAKCLTSILRHRSADQSTMPARTDSSPQPQANRKQTAHDRQPRLP